MTLLLVCLGAAVGAPVRFVVDRVVTLHTGGPLPWGTFTVNVVGSLLLGMLAGAAARGGVPPEVSAALGTGFCGALTTWSTLGWETLRLGRDGAGLLALATVAGNVVVSLAAAALGYLALAP